MTIAPLVVAPQRSVFAVGAYIVQGVLGVLHLTNIARPNSLIEATDHRIAFVWSIGLIVCSLIGLYGVLGSRKKPLDALSWESGGAMGLAILNGLYWVDLLAYTHGKGQVSLLTILGTQIVLFGIRFWQCQVDHTRLERVLRQQVADHLAEDSE